MIEQRPNLHVLLAGYLHQDWTWDYQSPEDAVADFVLSGPREIVRAAQVELAEVLRTMSDIDLDVWLDRTGCMYYPPADGLTNRSWLERVDLQLRRALEGDPHWRPDSKGV